MPPTSFHVLIVDDSLAIRTTLVSRFTARGFQVTAADNGISALALATSQTFDAVVTDLQMPGMNGLELGRSLHKIKPQVPLFLITGDPDFVDAETPEPFQALLTKPFHADTLCDMVSKNLLSRQNVMK